MGLQKTLILGLSALILVACGKPDGSEYLGTWKGRKGEVVQIVRDGNVIFMVVPNGDKYPATLESGNTLLVSGVGGRKMTLAYSKSTDSIQVGDTELRFP